MIRDLIRHRILRQPLKLLPDKPSALIRVALADLRAVENSPNYDVNMALWHCPAVDADDTCTVCFAGAVMAQRLGADLNESSCPLDYDQETYDKLVALNKFRQGKLGYGLGLMDIPLPEGFKRNWHVVEYETDREQFHEDMHNVASYLEEHGL